MKNWLMFLCSFITPVRRISKQRPGIIWRGNSYLTWECYQEECKRADFSSASAAMLRVDRDFWMKGALANISQARKWKAEAEKLNTGKHWQAVAKELQRRIDRFLAQKEKVRRAYTETVYLCSHGQTTIEALTDPEEYLMLREDGKMQTVGDLIREAERMSRVDCPSEKKNLPPESNENLT